MSEAKYDVIITGKLVDGVAPEQALERVARLFKTSVQQAAKLVDGRPHRIKKQLPEDAARKFKTALTKAGLQTVAKASQTPVAAAPAQTPQPSGSAPPVKTGTLTLAPEGTPVLRANEREEVIPPAIDLTGLSIAEMEAWEGSGTSDFVSIEPPDFGLAEPGAEIETLPDTREKVNPDTSKLRVEDPGVQLGKPGKEPPEAPDTSHIKLEKHNPFL